jgi:3-oxoacyl-[acyl-carrier protein] reductase
MKNLKNKTVWITGAKRIGQIVGENLAKNGSNIIVSYRGSSAESEKIVNKAKSLGVKAISVKCDVSKKEDVVNALKEVRKTFKKVDILINMASVFTPVALDNIKKEDWDRNYEAHILGTFWTSKLFQK